MPRAKIIRQDTMDLQMQEQDRSRPGGGAMGHSQSSALRNAAEDNAQAQLDVPVNGDLDLEPDLTNAIIHVNESGAIGIGGEPGELIRTDTEDQGSEEADDLFDERVSSSPSIDDEDIDFEFVYALHTFVATVEGQANAVKGETMVLLDDSNSYWWLVRIVKDQSIGYLPAEHIETPSERLARLNKHRNVDLSAAMLHDVPAKIPNPIKTALRRRGAKSVAFAPIQYFEYIALSEEESEDEGDQDFAVDEEEENQIEDEDEITVVEPLEPVARLKPTLTIDTKEKPKDREIDDTAERLRGNSNTSLRDIDSALLDSDTMETKKITLTPRVAQDDTPMMVNQVIPQGRDKQRSSSDRDRVQKTREDLVSPPPSKGGKPRKGSSVLNRLFNKKSKKGKKDEEADEFLQSGEKSSLEQSRDSQDSTEVRQQQLDPQSRRLEPRVEPQKFVSRQEPRVSEPMRQNPNQGATAPLTIRKVEPESPVSERPSIQVSIDRSPSQPLSHKPMKEIAEEPIPVDDSAAHSEAETTFEIDTPIEKNSSPRIGTGNGHEYSPVRPNDTPQQRSPVDFLISRSGSSVTTPDRGVTESPLTYTPVENEPPALEADNDNDEEVSPVESITDTFEETLETSSAQPVIWSDTSLKRYFDNENDVRDFLVVVQDKSDVNVQPDHPEIQPLFQDTYILLQDITNRLDNLLEEYYDRRRVRS